MNADQIKDRIAILKAANDAAPGWGAAVGARLEEIDELERALRPPILTLEERLLDIASRVVDLPYFKNERVEALVRDAKDALAISSGVRKSETP